MRWEPWATSVVDNTPWIPREVQRLLEIHLLDEEVVAGSPLPKQTHSCAMHLVDDPRLVCWCGITYTIIWALIDDLYTSLTYLEMHEVTCVPSHLLGAPEVYYVENKGPTPCPLLLEVLFIIMALMDFIKLLKEPNDMYYWPLDLLRGLLFFLWASLVGLSPKVSYLHIIFYFRG